MQGNQHTRNINKRASSFAQRSQSQQLLLQPSAGSTWLSNLTTTAQNFWSTASVSLGYDPLLSSAAGAASLGALYTVFWLARRHYVRAIRGPDDNIHARPLAFDEGGDDPRAVTEEIQNYMRAHLRLQQTPQLVLDPYMEERIEGLANIGNTCYMNSLIQALCSMTGFGEFLRELQNLRPQSEFVKHMVHFYQGRNGDPQAFHTIMSRYTDQFGNYDQQDAHELFGFVVAILAEEMADGRRLQEQLLARQAVDQLDQYLRLPEPSQESADASAASADSPSAASPSSRASDESLPDKRARQKRHQNSVLARPLNPFAGLESNLLQCNTCGNMSQILHESFTSLLVNVNNQGGNVLNSLQSYSRAEALQGVRCEFCGAQVTLDNLRQALARLGRRQKKLQPFGEKDSEAQASPALRMLRQHERNLQRRAQTLRERICEIDPRCYPQFAADLGLPDSKVLSEERLRPVAERFELPDNAAGSEGAAAAVPDLAVDQFAGAQGLALTPALNPVISLPLPAPSSPLHSDSSATAEADPAVVLKDLNVEEMIKKSFFQKQMCFARLPKLLCIHINRLMGGYKDSSWVSFPTTLDLGAFQKTVMGRYSQASFPGRAPGGFRQQQKQSRVPQEDDSDGEEDERKQQPLAGGPFGSRKDQCRYRLCSVVMHLGAAGGGHFITFRRRRPVFRRSKKQQRQPQQEWVRISDNHVQEVSEETVLRSEAYLLFYERLR